MQIRAHSFRSRLTVLGVVALAIVLAAPAAGARDRYHGGGHGADVVGALVVGALIGGVLATASQNRGDAYYNGAYYQPQPVYAPPPPVYYEPYPAYPAYAPPVYGGGVHIGVVYSSAPARRWHRGDRGHYYGRYGR